MELWEFNACVRAYTGIAKRRQDELIANAWYTANFVSAAFGGKLKKLPNYLKDEASAAQSPSKITPEQIAVIDRRLAERRANNGASRP